MFQISDELLVRTHRQSSTVNHCIQEFFLLYEGLPTVIEVKSQNAYVLKDQKSNLIFETHSVIFF